MVKQRIGRIRNTGKAHKWLKYPCLLAQQRGKEAAARLWAAVNRRREAAPKAKPFVSGQRPSARIMAVALSVCMALSLLPMAALGAGASTVTTAAELVTALGGTGKAEASDSSVTLKADVELDKTISINGDLTLDLGAYTITGAKSTEDPAVATPTGGNDALALTGGTLTVTGTTGKIIVCSYSNASTGTIYKTGGSGVLVSGGALTVAGGTIAGGRGGDNTTTTGGHSFGGTGGIGVEVTGGSVSVTGGEISGGTGGIGVEGGFDGQVFSGGYGHGGNGIKLVAGIALTVAGGTITGGDGGGVYGEGGSGVYGDVTIKGGAVTINGGNSYLKDDTSGKNSRVPSDGVLGNVTIEDGTVTITGGDCREEESSERNGGSGVRGAVTITGGTATITGGRGFTKDGNGYGGTGVLGTVSIQAGTATFTGGPCGGNSPVIGKGVGVAVVGQGIVGSSITLDEDAGLLVKESADNITFTKVAEAVGKYTSDKRYVKVEIDSGSDSDSGAGSDSSSGSSGSTIITSSTKNPDGSTTTTVKNPVTGTVTETTVFLDGSKTVVESKKDGSKTETVETPDGSKTQLVTSPTGDKSYTSERADGSKLSAQLPKGGDTTAKVTLPAGTKSAVVSFPTSGGNVVLRTRAYGTEAPLAYSLVEDGMAYVRVDGNAELRVESQVELFTDMSDHWAGDEADFVAARGLFHGTASRVYSPNATMTRGMLSTVLHRLDGEPQVGTPDFEDVASDAWYSGGVAWAVKNGVAAGIGGNLFTPERAISRQELAVMLWNYAKSAGMDVSAGESSNSLSFTDMDKAAHWAIPALQWACGSGIFEGSPEGRLKPDGTATRAEVAAMLARFISQAVQ